MERSLIAIAGMFIITAIVVGAWVQNEQEARKLQIEVACIEASGQIENGHCVVYTKGK